MGPEAELAGRRRDLTADDVLEMVNRGALRADEPVELLDGELVPMTPQGPLHATLNSELRQRLADAYRSLGHVRDQMPLAAGPTSLPEPDIAVIRGPARAFLSRHPSGTDTILAVEVAATSQARDAQKIAIYAAVLVPTLWLLDLEARTLTVLTLPESGNYRARQTLEANDEVPLPLLADTWPIRSMLA